MATRALNITIVGAGIAGLGAAIVLCREGHNVTIVEKSQFKEEAGFMIILSWNATRVLESIGFNFTRGRSSNSEFIREFNGKTLSPGGVINIETPGVENSQCRTFYRPDLHSELKRLALNPGAGKKIPTLLLGRRVIDVDIETATITLEEGSTITSDLIIGADGERSVVKSVFGDPDTLRKARYRIFRSLVPTEKILVDEDTRIMLEMTRGSFCMFLEGKRTMFWFEGRDALLQDLEAGYVPDESDGPVETDPVKAKQKMLERFSDYHPNIVKFLRKATHVSEWEVSYFPRPHPRLHKGQALIIGDAAHSMFPTTGQGGSQTLEDIGALSSLFATDASSLFPFTSVNQVTERLKMFEKIRMERIALVMGMSRCIFGKEEEFVRDRPWLLKTELGSGEGHTRFLFDYDVLKHCRRVLEAELLSVEGLKARL